MEQAIYNTELTPVKNLSNQIESVYVVVKQYSKNPEEGEPYRDKFVIGITDFMYDVPEENQSMTLYEIFEVIEETDTYKEATGVEIYRD
jgi:glycerol-3-phosphate dehydrogenase